MVIVQPDDELSTSEQQPAPLTLQSAWHPSAPRVLSADKLMYDSIPTSLTLVHSVAIKTCSDVVCDYKDYTYVGLTSGGVSRIDPRYRVLETFVTNDSKKEGCLGVASLTVYKDKLYVLVSYHDIHEVKVYKLDGSYLRGWCHIDIPAYTSIIILSGQVIIPDRQIHRLAVYSLEGELKRYIPVPQLSLDWVSLCSAGNNNVIVSDYGSSQVFRIDILSGQVMWTSRTVPKPLGVVCYQKKYAYISSEQGGEIWILCIKTGQSPLSANFFGLSCHKNITSLLLMLSVVPVFGHMI